MPLHPATVHFPIALLLASLGFYAVHQWKQEAYYQRTGFLLHLIGVISMVIAVLTGNQAQSAIEGIPVLEDIVQQHQISGFVLLWLLSMMLIWRYLRQERMQSLERWLFLGLFFAAMGLMTYSAHLGGTMVFEHGAGVMGK